MSETIKPSLVNLQDKMQPLMYYLTKSAARDSYKDFLDSLGISDEDYVKIKQVWKDGLGITPYC